MDGTILLFIKDYLWAPLLGLIAWAWNRNEKEHESLKSKVAELADKAADIRQHTSDGYSLLNDRIMNYIDVQVKETKLFVVAEDTKLLNELSTQRNHIAKIYDKLEDNSRRSEDRHLETLAEIRNLATTMHQSLATKADKER